MTKQEIRNLVKRRIGLMTTADKTAASEAVCRDIIGTLEWHEAGTVLLYSALPDELDLSLLVQDALRQGKSVFLPVVDGDNLQIRQYTPGRMLRAGEYGISEPGSDCPLIGRLEELDLAVIPGRAFTRGGLRLGRGKGFYDRILPELSCPEWGVAFACQLVDELPVDPWDVPLDRIFAE